ncbi:signal peptide peptidase-like 2B [Haliotis rubra]|uniref:signal peptide peptidase-like 2B n=1 Tax=Haliotis rubra TaxID=36100 RepID=UPI001EE5285E|nr:signal peptide peptidase-like 2B [Haliotis rubra]
MLIKLFVIIVGVSQVLGEYGVLKVQATSGASSNFCFAYNKDFKTIPSAINDTEKYQLVHLRSYGCNDSDWTIDVKGKVVTMARGPCKFVEKATLAQNHQAAGILSVSNRSDTQLVTPGGNESAGDYQNINIVVGFIMWKDNHSLDHLADGGSLSVWMYTPADPKIDPNMVLIYAIALTCIIIGAYWSGTTRYALAERKSHRRKGSVDSSRPEDKQDEEQPETLSISVCVVVVLFVVICTMIVLLYFFYDYLVYGVIGLFCLAGAVGLYSCLQPLWERVIRSDCRIPPNRVPVCSEQPEIRNIVLGLLCLGVSIFWAVERKASYAWIIQDILGMAFSVNMLKTIRLPNFMACTVLLVLLFFYDIFFVFITPYFTKNGSSIMVDVATGGKSHSGEQLPMVFKVPRFLTPPDAVCYSSPYSLLGFGDVIVPGLLISFNHGFDLIVKSRRIYFIASTIAYAVGLILTYVALALMKTGQPALLYLVPCTLLTTAVIGCKRGELRFLWTGKECPKKNDDVRPPGQCVRSSPEGESDTSSLSSDGERRGLINA